MKCRLIKPSYRLGLNEWVGLDDVQNKSQWITCIELKLYFDCSDSVILLIGSLKG